MAKTSNKATQQPSQPKSAPTRPNVPTAPQGYKRHSDDVTGFWDPDHESGYCSKTLHWIPREAKLSDSKIESYKPSILIIGELLDACILLAKDPNDSDALVPVEAAKGDIVGVWGKPGMRGLRMLSGRKVFMYRTGEKDVGKPNAMKLYDIHAQEGTPKELVITDDRRKDSAHVKTWLTPDDGAPATDEPPAF